MILCFMNNIREFEFAILARTTNKRVTHESKHEVRRDTQKELTEGDDPNPFEDC